MATGITILDAALQSLQVIIEGATSNTNQRAVGLARLNALLENLNTKRQMVYHILQEDFTWSGGAVSKTIGPTATTPDFITVRPMRIEYAVHRDSANQDTPLAVTEDRTVYERIMDKTLSVEPPSMLFYDQTWPKGTLYIWPIPPSSWTLRLSTWKQLSALATIGDTVDLPPGYQAYLEWNLAKWLWPTYPTDKVLQLINEMARQTEADLKRFNLSPIPHLSVIELGVMTTRGTTYNINTDSYHG